MKFHYSKHVHEELEKRKLSLSLLEEVLQAPEQKVPEVDEISCYQSRVKIGGKRYLMRVLVNDTVSPPLWYQSIVPVKSRSIGGQHESQIRSGSGCADH